MNPRVDFNDDTGQRLMWQLRDVPFRKQLEPAVRLAGRQLEHLKPAAMAMTANGAVTGPVAEVTRGTILVCLANRKKVVTIQIPDQPRRSELLSASLIEWDPRKTPIAIDTFVAHWGGARGERKPDIPLDCTRPMLATLLSTLGAKQTQIGSALEELVALDVCPAMVAVVGAGAAGKPDTLSGAWRVILPLAPYLAPYFESIAV